VKISFFSFSFRPFFFTPFVCWVERGGEREVNLRLIFRKKNPTSKGQQKTPRFLFLKKKKKKEGGLHVSCLGEKKKKGAIWEKNKHFILANFFLCFKTQLKDVLVFFFFFFKQRGIFYFFPFPFPPNFFCCLGGGVKKKVFSFFPKKIGGGGFSFSKKGEGGGGEMIFLQKRKGEKKKKKGKLEKKKKEYKTPFPIISAKFVGGGGEKKGTCRAV